MKRLALAGGALAVVALLVFLVVQLRSGAGDGGDTAHAARTTDRGDTAAGASAGAGLAGRRPVRMTSDEADASPLPTPEEEAEMRARVTAERMRPPHMAPEILDHGLTAKPMRDARNAFHRGDYDKTLARAQDALSVEPDNNSARVLAVLSACALGKRATAQAHADKLDELRKWRVAERCKKFGIEIRGAHPVDENR